MKAFAITLALAGVATAAPMSAQIVARTVPVTNRPACVYTRTTNSVGDIIFGRTTAARCADVSTREDGAWYQVGRGANNNSIYRRRVRDANGNLVIQQGRRNPDGTFAILSTRAYSSTDKEWRKAQKAEHKAWKKQQKAEDKEMKSKLSDADYKNWKKQEKAENKATDANFKASMKASKGKSK